MDENTQSQTVFGGTQKKVQEGGGPPPLPAGDPLESDSSGFIFKILKIFLSLVFVSIFAFLIIKFVLPRFSSPENKTVTIKYWGLWEDKNIMQKMISDFERESPNIKVEYSRQDIKQYRERLVTRIENGEGPDIFRFHNTWVLQLSNYLLPLPSEVISTEEFGKTFYPVAQKDLIRNGAIYGMPLEMDLLSLFVNKELFDAGGVDVPGTWEDFLATAKSLTVKDDSGRIKTAGAAMGTFDNIKHAPDIISLLLAQNGANLENLSETIPQTTDALVFYTSFAKDEGNVWDNTLEASLLSFAKGNLAMYFGFSWDVFTLKELNPALQFEVHSIPKLPGREQTIASYWVEGISSRTKYPEESLIFLKFLAKKETSQKFYTESSKTRLFGEPFARIDLSSSLKDNNLVYPFIKDGPYAVSSFFAGDTFDNGLNSQMNNYLGNAVRSILGNTSPESAVETLYEGVDQVLGQYSENKQISK